MGRRERLGLEVEQGVDYYALLRVRPDATTDQIEHAFHEQAKKFHPDVNASPDAERTFQLLVDAHDILSDRDLRADYDARRVVAREARATRTTHTPPPTTPHHDDWRSMWQPSSVPTEHARAERRPRTRHAGAVSVVATLVVGLLGFALPFAAIEVYARVPTGTSTTVTATRVRVQGVPSLRYVTRDTPGFVGTAPGRVIVIHDSFSDAASAKRGSTVRVRYSNLDPTHVTRVDPPRNVMLVVATITAALAMLGLRVKVARRRRRRRSYWVYV